MPNPPALSLRDSVTSVEDIVLFCGSPDYYPQASFPLERFSARTTRNAYHN
jgi:hypothetical protein